MQQHVTRAVVVCYIQVVVYFSYYIIVFMTLLLSALFTNQLSVDMFWIKLQIFLGKLEFIFYVIAIIVDSIMLLFVLKSYRMALILFYRSLRQRCFSQNPTIQVRPIIAH